MAVMIQPNAVFMNVNVENRRERVFREFDMNYSDDQLYARYRFRRDTLNFLINLLAEDLERPTKRNHALSVETQILVTLRFLASGSFLQVIGDTLGLDKSTISRCVSKVCEALVKQKGGLIKWPILEAEKNKIKKGFFDIGGFPNVVGCIDGTHVRIQAPSTDEPAYVNRKGWHSINVQAVFDHEGRITNVCVRWPGSAHNSHIFRTSNLCTYLTDHYNRFSEGVLLGDSGYPCRPFLLTPYPNPNTRREERFNDSLCATRVTIERTFGRWKRRFHILHSEIVLLSTQSKAQIFKLSTALWQSGGRRFQTVFWNMKQMLRISIDQVFPNINYGLNNMHIAVTTLEWPMFVTSKQLADGTTQYLGMCIDLLIEASRKLNFSYTIKSPEDREWGRKLNGNWTGLIGDIVYKKADLQVAPVSVQEERVAVMDFTTAFYTDYYNIIFKMPDKEKTRWMILLRPLNWKSLLTVACLFPLVTFCVWLCERFSPFYDNVPRRSTYPGLHRIDDCLLYMCGALFTRSGNYLPRALSGRTILSFWWLFVVLLVASYCGNLIAFLTVTRDKKPFNTIADMVQQDQYKWGTNAGAYLFEVLRSSKDPEYEKVWAGMNRFAETNPDVMAISLGDHEMLLEKGNYVYIADSLVVDTFVNMNCEFVKGSEEFLMSQYSVGLPKNSAYTSLFTDQIRHFPRRTYRKLLVLIISFHEGGLIEMWIKRWSPKAISCSSLLQTEAKKIMLIDIQSSFYVLLGGIALSCVVCVAEVLSKKWQFYVYSSKKYT